MSETTAATALVTGASRGIGRELALLLARDGFDPILTARSERELQALAAKLEELYGVDARVYARDLSEPEAARRLYEDVRSDDLQVDILVNNAGFGAHGGFDEMNPETSFDMMQLNMVTLTQLSRFCVKDMLERGTGRVLNVASTAAFQPGPLMAVYYASKAYVLSFSEALAEEVSGTGVTVTALCPGPTSTSFQEEAGLEETIIGEDTPFMMAAEEVAREGYRGLMEGERLVIPGLINKMQVQSLRLAPRKLVTRLARKVQERR